ncbi:MAG: HAD-IA family hydrolase [Candidatus Dormibacteraeota bacterium]|nr:HAD-IA family hydrolase [Candidatus Dormibacteraeota bacterium]
MLSALVFDFDGLIVDTEGPVFQAWSEVYAEHGQSLDRDFWTTIVGRSDHFDPIAELERRLTRTVDRATVQAARRSRELELVHAQPVLPGVREWRAEAHLAGLRQGVASSSSRAWVLQNLERLGLDRWDCVRCRDDVGRSKPDPAVYLAVLDCLGVPAANALAIEDSNPGVRAAKAAGLRCVAVPGPLTSGHDFALADLVLASLEATGLSDAAARVGL